MKIQGKTIIVTGAGGGIGQQLVLEIIKRGGSAVAVDINKESLDKIVAMTPEGRISPFQLDITNKEAVSVFSTKMEALGVDGIINNAGIIQPFVKIEELDYSVIERVFNINFWGTLHLLKALLPHLQNRSEAHIVNVSSMGGFLPVPGQGIYGAAKAGIKLMTESLRSELLNTNVEVSVVFPGAVNTNIKANSGLNTDRKNTDNKKAVKITSPQEAASIIFDGMEKGKARILVGKDAKLMDWLCRLNPNFAAKLIAKKMQTS